MAEYSSTFGDQLRRLRELAGLSQEALAEKAGLSANAISALERGQRHHPYPATLHALAAALELSAEERDMLVSLARPGAGPSLVEPAHRARQAANVSQGAASPLVGPRRVALPVAPEALIGRESERAELARYLRSPGRRLITLTGPGGIGKTRLAVDVAAALSTNDDPAFADGVAVAYLATAASVSDVLLAIAGALAQPIQGARPTADQVIDALRKRAMLLVLDNLEHLLGPGVGEELASLLGRVLVEAPGVRLLATSRERLRLHDEWVLELGGLEVPASDDGPRVEQAEAVRLFVERARRVAPGFALSAESRADLARLCRRLEGMPLAIELAAAWARTLTPGEIAAEVERALDFLAGRERDVPARHRSMRAALDHSWSLLDDDERRTVARLAVFRGGCDHDALTSVTLAAPATIRSLIDKSLVRREESGGTSRYSVHELVRQYGIERLAADAHDLTATEARHTSHFVGLLKRAIVARTGASTPDARVSLDRNIDNLRAVWARAAAAGDSVTLAAMSRGLRIIYDGHGWLLDGAALFGHAADALRETDVSALAIRGYILGLQGYFLVRAGRSVLARPVLEEGLALLQATGASEGLDEIMYSLGILELRLARYAESREWFTQVSGLAHARDDDFRRHWAEFYLGRIAHALGAYEDATVRYQVCLEAWRTEGYARGEATGLIFLGELARLTGRHDRAAALLSESLQIASGVHDQLGIGMALTQLGELAQERGEVDEARYLLGESTQIMRAMGDAWLLGRGLAPLVRAEIGRGDLAAARQACVELVGLVRSGEAVLIAEAAYSIALLLERDGRVPEALALLIALDGKAGEYETLRRAARLRSVLEGSLDQPERTVAAATAGRRQLLPWLEELSARTQI